MAFLIVAQWLLFCVFFAALSNIPLCLLAGLVVGVRPLFRLFLRRRHNYQLILGSWRLSLPQRVCSKRLARLTFIFGMLLLALNMYCEKRKRDSEILIILRYTPGHCLLYCILGLLDWVIFLFNITLDFDMFPSSCEGAVLGKCSLHLSPKLCAHSRVLIKNS